ncbi:MAG: ribbon-helix-helix protein, CopG family [Bradyrhizobium sp.]|nr:ribbon-helix-helix protein, CopG family [Bradyrhizobium sp.]
MIAGKTGKKRGRPSTGRDPSVTIRLPSALLEWIDSKARENDTGRSEMIRRLIEESRLGVPQEIGQIRTAYHEAGHAVVARVLGIPVTIATITKEGSSLGHVVIGESVWDLHRRLCGAGTVAKDRAVHEATAWRVHIMVMMAGRAAETTLLGFHHDDKGNRQDKHHIKRLAKVLPARSHDEILEELEIKTETIVKAMPNSIRRVAEALKRSKSLNQSRIDRIIAAAGESWTQRKRRARS